MEGVAFTVRQLAEQVLPLVSTLLLQSSEPLLHERDLIDVVEQRVVQVALLVALFELAFVVIVALGESLQTFVIVLVTVEKHSELGVLVNFRFLAFFIRPLLLFETNFDALLAEVCDGAHEVRRTFLDGLVDLTGLHEQGGQSDQKALDFKVASHRIDVVDYKVQD